MHFQTKTGTRYGHFYWTRLSLKSWCQVLQVNLNAVWTLTRDTGAHMLSTLASTSELSPKPHKKIINIASLLSFQGGLTVPAYAAAKHGVVGVVSRAFVVLIAHSIDAISQTKSFSNEWSSKGININW